MLLSFPSVFRSTFSMNTIYKDIKDAFAAPSKVSRVEGDIPVLGDVERACLSLSVRLPQICRFYFAFRGPPETGPKEPPSLPPMAAAAATDDDSTMCADVPRVDLKLNARNARRRKERKKDAENYIRASINEKNALVLHGFSLSGKCGKCG